MKFLRPRGEVLASWRRTIAYAYTPERLFARFRYQVDATYANRLRLPAKGKLTKVNLKRGAVLAWNIFLFYFYSSFIIEILRLGGAFRG